MAPDTIGPCGILAPLICTTRVLFTSPASDGLRLLPVVSRGLVCRWRRGGQTPHFQRRWCQSDITPRARPLISSRTSPSRMISARHYRAQLARVCITESRRRLSGMPKTALPGRQNTTNCLALLPIDITHRLFHAIDTSLSVPPTLFCLAGSLIDSQAVGSGH